MLELTPLSKDFGNITAGVIQMCECKENEVETDY